MDLFVFVFFYVLTISRQNEECAIDTFLSANGTCEVCPIGFYGQNCAKPCKAGYFGRGCTYQCHCDKSYCNNSVGCVNDAISDCPGGFYGKNCASPCKAGYYGVGCSSKCQCDVVYCNSTSGCGIGITKESEGGIIQRNIISIAAVVSALLVVLTIAIVLCRIRFADRNNTPTTERGEVEIQQINRNQHDVDEEEHYYYTQCGPHNDIQLLSQHLTSESYTDDELAACFVTTLDRTKTGRNMSSSTTGFNRNAIEDDTDLKIDDPNIYDIVEEPLISTLDSDDQLQPYSLVKTMDVNL